MDTNDAKPVPARIVLHGNLAEVGRLSAWVEDLYRELQIAPETLFAIDLCLEEVVSNIIRHGYDTCPGGSIEVSYSVLNGGELIFTVEDDAPPFNPLEASLPTVTDEQGELRVGGQGLRLLRGFAYSLEYQLTPKGNRLLIGFSRFP